MAEQLSRLHQAMPPMNQPFAFRRRNVLLTTLLLGLSVALHATSSGKPPTAFATPFELSDGWETAEYKQAIEFYRKLADSNPRVRLYELGMTDSGFPLHLVLISGDGEVALTEVETDARSVLLINNAIHPGESDGVDASMAFARDLAMDHLRYDDVLADVIIAIIPVYNIGGALNRNSHSRANQNGPREYGFRGNGRNYDLNRDFIKCDTRNARSFAQVFHQLDPDLFLDTHVSNGADYQHVMTTSQSQKDKLGLKLGSYLHEEFEPMLFSAMDQAGFPTIPYVNSGGSPPQQGFPQFLETARYSTGFTGLFQTMGYMTETHMLKPYPQRVEATRAFMDQAITLLAKHGQKIQEIKAQDREAYPKQSEAAIAWEVDRNRASRLAFRGYESNSIPSRVTTGNRLFYDRSKPFTQNIPYYNHYVSSKTVRLPAGYLIPREWHSVIDLMKLNRVKMSVAVDESQLLGEVYRIEDVETRTRPYEGHFFHDKIETSKVTELVTVRPGDFIVPINQRRARYVVETLEPQAMDSLARWNYFDSVLQRKEHFSPYIFEEEAEKMLADDEDLRDEFDQKKKEDAEFAESRYSQLDFLYRRSKHYERSHRRYPVVRLLGLPE